MSKDQVTIYALKVSDPANEPLFMWTIEKESAETLMEEVTEIIAGMDKEDNFNPTIEVIEKEFQIKDVPGNILPPLPKEVIKFIVRSSLIMFIMDKTMEEEEDDKFRYN